MARVKRYTRSIIVRTSRGFVSLGQVPVQHKPLPFNIQHQHIEYRESRNLEAIVGERSTADGQKVYLAKWLDLPIEKATWESRRAFTVIQLQAWEKDKRQIEELKDSGGEMEDASDGNLESAKPQIE